MAEVRAALDQKSASLRGDAWGQDLTALLDALPEGCHYTEREARVAIADAEAILEFCTRSIPR